MTVDLSKVKAGDTVRFRCGGEAIIYRYRKGTYDDKSFIEFLGSGRGNFYFQNNGLFGDGNNYPFDIIEVIPLGGKQIAEIKSNGGA